MQQEAPGAGPPALGHEGWSREAIGERGTCVCCKLLVTTLSVPQLPGRKYRAGYNEDVGDKWIWLK